MVLSSWCERQYKNLHLSKLQKQLTIRKAIQPAGKLQWNITKVFSQSMLLHWHANINIVSENDTNELCGQKENFLNPGNIKGKQKFEIWKILYQKIYIVGRGVNYPLPPNYGLSPSPSLKTSSSLTHFSIGALGEFLLCETFSVNTN